MQLRPEDVKHPETEFRLPRISDSLGNVFALTSALESEGNMSPRSKHSSVKRQRPALENSYGLTSFATQKSQT